MADLNGSSSSKKRWFRLRYDEGEDSPTETRNVLLIILSLIAAVTFQAGVNPPGGVWQDNKDGPEGHKAGSAIYAAHRHAFLAFLIANTIAFSTTIPIIISLTYKFPFHLEIWVALLSMFATYASAIFAIAPDESVKFRYVFCAAVAPFVLQGLKKLYYMLWSCYAGGAEVL